MNLITFDIEDWFHVFNIKKFYNQIKTDFSKALWDNKKTLNKQIEITPLKRIGYPEDISGIVHFLASSASSFITGQMIIADGGETITSVIS